jgi:hypothetical protein
MTAVNIAPTHAPLRVLRAMDLNHFRVEAPLPLRIPSLMIRIPKRNSPNPPRMVSSVMRVVIAGGKIEKGRPPDAPLCSQEIFKNYCGQTVPNAARKDSKSTAVT